MRTLTKKPFANRYLTTSKPATTVATKPGISHKTKSTHRLQREVGNHLVIHFLTDCSKSAKSNDVQQMYLQGIPSAIAQRKPETNLEGGVDKKKRDLTDVALLRMPIRQIPVANTHVDGCVDNQTSPVHHQELRDQQIERRRGYELTSIPRAAGGLSTPSQLLNPITTAYMETRFGYEFNDKKNTSSGLAASSTQAINALAFTSGPPNSFGETKQRYDRSARGHVGLSVLTRLRRQDELNPRALISTDGSEDGKTSINARFNDRKGQHSAEQGKQGPRGQKLLNPNRKAALRLKPAKRSSEGKIAPNTVHQKSVTAGSKPSKTLPHQGSALVPVFDSKVESSSKAASANLNAGGLATHDAVRDVADDIRTAGISASKVGSPEKKAAETQQAMGLPASQSESISQWKKVSALASELPPPFDRALFKTRLRERIMQLKADDAKSIKDGDKANQVNQAVQGEVAVGKEVASCGIQQANAQAPTGGPAPIPGKEIPPVANVPTPQIDASKAAPQPVADSRTSLAVESHAIDQTMSAANVTPEQLARSNEPEFKAAAAGSLTAQTQATAVPEQVRARESSILGQTKSALAATTSAGLNAMHGSRNKSMGAVSDHQAATKAKREATKAQLSRSVNAIYEGVNKAVADRLEKMDSSVKSTFDEGASTAKTNFNLFLTVELLQYFVGGGWIVDAFTEGNDYKAIFEHGRAEYIAEMDVVIDNVASVVETAMNEIVVLVQKAKSEIDDLIAALPEEDRAVGEEVIEGTRSKFAELQSTIEQKQQGVIDDISQKYVAAVKEVDSLIDILKNPAGAIISAAIDMLSGVIATIMKMRELLMGIAAKAGEAIDLILADPIKFLANLIAGVKKGIENFVANIGTYLKRGLLDWMFGALAGAGIKIPEKFDLSGLLSIVLQVLGLTYDNFRKRAVLIVGEKTVAAIEKASEIFMILITKGAAGLWEFIKEQATAFLETLKDGVKSLVIENVIKAGVKWIIGLLNPASAFVKACMAIYDIVNFIISRGSQILEFVNAVVGSILSIAKGTIAPAAQAVEAALAKSVPVAIGFLASLLGLGDISKDIKAVIEKIQAPVNKAIDWLIRKAVELVKKIGKMFGGKEKPGEDEKEGKYNKLFDTIGERLTETVNSSEATIENVVPKIESEFRDSGLKNLIVKKDASGRPFVEASINPTVIICESNINYGSVLAHATIETLTSINEIEMQTGEKLHANEHGKSIMKPAAETSIIKRANPKQQRKKDPRPGDWSSQVITQSGMEDSFHIVARNTREYNPPLPLNLRGVTSGIHNISHAEEQLLFAFNNKAAILKFAKKVSIHVSQTPCDKGCVDSLVKIAGLLPSDCVRSITWDTLRNDTPPDFIATLNGFGYATELLKRKSPKKFKKIRKKK